MPAHVTAFSFYSGVPQLVVPDNPATSTHRPKRGESARVLTARHQQLAEQSSTGNVPVRAKRPRDKAAAESAVNVVNKRVIGYLAEGVFITVQALNSAIGALLVEINELIPRADGTTRWERFTADESGLLQRCRPTGSTQWNGCSSRSDEATTSAAIPSTTRCPTPTPGSCCGSGSPTRGDRLGRGPVHL